MFVQVIQGQVSSGDEVHAALDRWAETLASGATGWLGTTAGVTESGEFIALARFESQQAAQANSQRPEQDSWWSDTSRLFSGDVTFHDSTHVEVDTPGDPDTAGFVQVIQGRSSDPARARELMSQGDQEEWRAYRPDVIGSLTVEYDGDSYTTAIYFTSEAEARAGEQKEPPPDIKAAMDEMGSLSVGEPGFLDLEDPWLYSPA